MTQKEAVQLFEERKVRTVWDSEQEKWYFSIVDVVGILTESTDGRKYWNKLKQRLKEEGNETVTNCHQLNRKRNFECERRKKEMYDKFGEMSSYTEINELAENLANEGDVESLREMAKENGIPEDFVDLYLEGEISKLCDALIAAVGKLEVEAADLKLKGLMKDWVEYIKGLCMENEMIAHQVRKAGKSLKGCMAVLLKYSFENRTAVPKEIVKEAKISASRVDFGVPGMAEAKKMIKDYYLGGVK